MAVVEAHGLSRNFGTLTAVEDISLEMQEGEVLAFLGPNGAGKTTTIRMLAGIISPTRGYAVVAGHRTDGEPEKLHESTGLLTEAPGFYSALSAWNNLEFYAGLYEKLDTAGQIEKYLKIAGLWDRRYDKVGTFSKGMKQRLALARALIHEPEVIFLDEPTAALDPEAALDVRSLIRKLSNEGRTIFLSTHNLTEAEQLCNRIAVVHTHLLALDTVEGLRQKLFKQQVIVRMENIPESIVETVGKLDFVRNVGKDENRLTVELTEPENDRPDLIKSIVDAGGRIMSVSEQHHSLEEVYISLVKEK
ncbi:MAG: ABC transporter ATP-binding protein [Dehalococcoidales bacterium]|nr:ABC transporter ATP-binding protein [Dehalococcoidales bacterium]